MNVKQLIEELQKLEKDHGDCAMTVNCFSNCLRGSNAEVTNVGVGFDWTSGQVVLRTKPQLYYYTKVVQKEIQKKAVKQQKKRKLKKRVQKYFHDNGYPYY